MVSGSDYKVNGYISVNGYGVFNSVKEFFRSIVLVRLAAVGNITGHNDEDSACIMQRCIGAASNRLRLIKNPVFFAANMNVAKVQDYDCH